jgi:hypothetical protein
MNKYYERDAEGGGVELCQTRFKDTPNHPHNVCAVASNHKTLVAMYFKHLTGGVDWLYAQAKTKQPRKSNLGQPKEGK